MTITIAMDEPRSSAKISGRAPFFLKKVWSDISVRPFIKAVPA